MSNPPVVVVDEQDQPIGSASVTEVREKGLLHRIVRVMVEDPAGNIVLQRRLPDAHLYPDRWDNSAAGHVDVGETYEGAALRELAEEIGLSDVTLQEIGYYRHTGTDIENKLDRFNKVYKVVVSPDTKFVAQPDEVADIKWFTLEEAKKLAAEHPEQVTDGVVDVLKRYY